MDAQLKAQSNDLEASVEAAIAACDGDMRAAIRSPVIVNGCLGAENERLGSLTSAGYARGKLSLIEWLTRLP